LNNILCSRGNFARNAKDQKTYRSVFGMIFGDGMDVVDVIAGE
jgi:hypothetical protein